MSRSRYYPGPSARARRTMGDHVTAADRARDTYHHEAILAGEETYHDLRDCWVRLRYQHDRPPVDRPGRALAPRRIRRAARSRRAAERRRIAESMFVLRAGAPTKGLCFSGRVFVDMVAWHDHECGGRVVTGGPAPAYLCPCLCCSTSTTSRAGANRCALAGRGRHPSRDIRRKIKPKRCVKCASIAPDEKRCPRCGSTRLA